MKRLKMVIKTTNIETQTSEVTAIWLRLFLTMSGMMHHLMNRMLFCD